MPVKITYRTRRNYLHRLGLRFVALFVALLTSPRAFADTQDCLKCHASGKNAIASTLHGTVAMECVKCHLDHEADPSAKANKGYLKAAKTELCQGCHAEVTKKEFVHEPAKSDCMLCHSAHSAAKAALRAESNALCLECHSTQNKARLEADGAVALFGGQVTLSPHPFAELRLIDLKNGRGHPVANHPVLRRGDAERPAISCATCHASHGADHSSALLVTEEETFISLCQRCPE